MKKLLCCSVTVFAMLASGSATYATAPSQIVVNNRAVPSPSATPIVEKGNTLVPLRYVADALGASVSWDAGKRTVVATKWSDSITFREGSDTAFVVNGATSQKPKTVRLGAKVIVRQNHVYVPLRFIAQTFGYTVSLENNIISIKSPLSKKDRDLLSTGKLGETRQFVRSKALSNRRFAQQPIWYPSQGREGYELTFLFPQGEANRFFLVSGDTAEFYELIDGFFVVTWRALIPIGTEDELNLFLNGKFTQATGKYPTLGQKTFFYYTDSSIFTSERRAAGRINPDGTITQLGIKWIVSDEIKEQSGSLALELPSEVRQEVRLP